MLNTLMQLNYSLFQELNGPAGSYSGLDALMVFCANWLIFCFPLILLLFWGLPLAWRKRVASPQETQVLQERRAIVLWVAFACLLAYGLNLLIEQFIFEKRPFVSHHVHLLVAHAADASFPSDHTAWAFAVAGMLVPILFISRSAKLQAPQATRERFALPGILFGLTLLCALSIGFARVFVGVHYPGDILGGAIDGLLAALLITLLRTWLQRPTQAVLRFAQTLRLA